MPPVIVTSVVFGGRLIVLRIRMSVFVGHVVCRVPWTEHPPPGFQDRFRGLVVQVLQHVNRRDAAEGPHAIVQLVIDGGRAHSRIRRPAQWRKLSPRHAVRR